MAPKNKNPTRRCGEQKKTKEQQQLGLGLFSFEFAEQKASLGNDVLSSMSKECEAEQQAVPLPEVSALSSWPKVTRALLRAGICTEMADGGLPKVALDLHLQGAVVRLRAPMHQPEVRSSEVLFVTRQKGSEETDLCEAVGLPFDAEFFKLLTSEAALHAITTQLSHDGMTSIRFQSPETLQQLDGIRTRLRQELQELLRVGLTDDAPGLLSRLLRGASDAWQAEVLSGHEDPPERACKRLCLTWPGR